MKIREIILYVLIFVGLAVIGSFMREHEHNQIANAVINKLIKRGIIQE